MKNLEINLLRVERTRWDKKDSLVSFHQEVPLSGIYIILSFLSHVITVVAWISIPYIDHVDVHKIYKSH